MENKYSTTDISLATYICYREYKLIGSSKTNNKSCEWCFEIDKVTVEELKTDYTNSEFSKFEGIRRAMVKFKYK